MLVVGIAYNGISGWQEFGTQRDRDFCTLYRLLTQPGTFRRHGASSCTWPGTGEYFLECAQRYAVGPAIPATDLYLAVGCRDEEQLSGFLQLTELLTSGKFPNLRLSSRVIGDEGHTAGMIGKTILEGLKTVFQA